MSAKLSVSKLDPYRPLIRPWLNDDSRHWHKQRHTGRRIWQRLRGEHGLDVSESSVNRYLAKMHGERRLTSENPMSTFPASGRA